MALEVTRAAPVNPPPAEPDAQLPAALRRQIARSEELQQELQPKDEPQDSPPSDAPQDNLPPNGNGEVPPAPQGEDTETWEQRFRSLEGRYRSDMQRAAERQLQLEREAVSRPVTPQGNPPPEAPLITPDEVQEYGPEFVNLVERVAQQAQRPLLSQISSLQRELEATGRNVAVSANDRMHQEMNSRLEGWQAINNHPDFVAWSRLPDIYSGAIRQSLMQDAWNRGDASRVEAFFRGFLAEQGVQVPQGQPAPPAGQLQPQPNGSAAPVQPRVTLESLAAPGRARSAPPTPADKPVYTQAQILQFYTDVATGRFHGTPAEQQAIDRDIIAAQHEGRIVMDTRSAAQPPRGFTR
jgi:hypothetical protein